LLRLLGDMELADLEFGLKAVASGGNVLNISELTGVQAGLTVLKAKDNYKSIYLWGKIYGENADYYLAYGLKDSSEEFPSKSFYVAGADFDFMALPRPTEEAADNVVMLGLRKPMSGNASAPLDLGLPAEETPPESLMQLTEADRLAQLVLEIDFDTAVVPKGAHALNEASVVAPSSDFQGLSAPEATSLDKYVHFRPPTSVEALRALARTDSQFYGNFLDTLDGDLPKGCWAVRQDPGAVVTLRSLTWPGYVAFHVPGTNKFGGLYFGFASKSRDLPFTL